MENIKMPLRMLILEDRPEDAELMLYELRKAGFQPEAHRVDTEADFQAQLAANPDIILADYSLPQYGARQALQYLQERGLDIPFIVVTGALNDEEAAACIKEGARLSAQGSDGTLGLCGFVGARAPRNAETRPDFGENGIHRPFRGGRQP